jgi:hypothetical protein
MSVRIKSTAELTCATSELSADVLRGFLNAVKARASISVSIDRGGRPGEQSMITFRAEAKGPANSTASSLGSQINGRYVGPYGDGVNPYE